MKKRNFKTTVAAAGVLSLMMSLTACQQNSTTSTTAAPATTAAAQTEASTAAAESQTEAELNYPTANLTLVIPYAAGGEADNIFRCLEPVLSNYMNGNPVVAEIVSGGNAIPGTQQMLDAEPDGYTLVMCNPGNACIQPSLGNATYAFEDLQAVACLTGSPVLFAVEASAPYDDFEGWLEWVKAHPGEFTFCTGSLGGTPHLAMMKMLSALGIQDDVIYVPYSGNAEAYAAVAGGQIKGYASVPGGVIGKENVKPILNLGTADVEAYPDLQKLEEVGIDKAQATDVFWGVACSKNVDPAIVAYLSDAFEQALSTPEAQENMKNMNITPMYLNSEEFQVYMNDSYEAYAKVIEDLDMKQ